jgi:hypothetical protein
MAAVEIDAAFSNVPKVEHYRAALETRKRRPARPQAAVRA